MCWIIQVLDKSGRIVYSLVMGIQCHKGVSDKRGFWDIPTSDKCD
jgi:hypothetical protein